MLLTGVILNALISYFSSAILGRFIYFPVLFFAFIILNIEILSLFKIINGYNILILSFLFFIVVFVFWLKKNKPIINPVSYLITYFEKIKNALTTDGLLILPFFAWIFFIAVAFILALLVPPTEPDAQGYHALRALFWLKDGFISHFEATDMRMLCMPINSEIFYTWILALAKNDIGFGLLQFFSYFLLIFSNFKIMEFFEISVKKIVWAILLFTSFPAIIIQISSTQTDLIIAALFSYSICLVLNYTKDRNLPLLFVASLALALSFGIKTTAFFIAPAVFIWFIKILKKDFLKFFAFFILNFLIFSSYNYILNFIDFNSVLSNNAFILYNKFFGGIKTYISNLINYFIQFIDFSGLNLGKVLNNHIIELRTFLYDVFLIPDDVVQIDSLNKVNLNMDEQSGAFGILGFLVYIPSLLIALFKKKIRIFSVLFFVPFLILSGAMLYTIFGIRYIVAFVGISFPVLTLSYFEKNNILKVFMVLYMVFYLAYASLFIPARPPVYLFADYIKDYSIINIQDKMRRFDYKFLNPAYYFQNSAYLGAITPYCKNNNKVGLFASYAQIYYAAKYLELNNACRIDVLNILHINYYDLTDYKALVLPSNGSQQLNVINKNDILNPFVNSDKANCTFAISDRAKNPKNPLDASIYAACSLNNKYINSLGFKKASEFNFLEKNGDSFEISNMEVYSK